MNKISSVEDGRIPIVVAITGHRDCIDTDATRNLVRKELRRLIKSHPYSPFIAISPLAEGGDRLFAQAALAEAIPLVVPLPLPQATYEIDFPESVGAFREILAAAKTVFTLPYLSGNTAENTKDPGHHRDLQYAHVGFYVAQRAHILFALWDGEDTSLLGGTAQVVRFRLHGSVRRDVSSETERILAGVMPPLSPLDAVEFGLVCHIYARRGSNPGPVVSRPATWYPFEKARRDEFERAILQIDAYNEMVGSLQYPVVPDAEDARHRKIEGKLYQQFVAADRIANEKMSESRQIFRSIFILAAFQATGLEIYSEFWSRWPPLLWYLFCLALIVVLVGRLTTHGEHQQAIDYRALAEGLRVQRFWRIAGIDQLVAHHYLRRHAGSLRWVRVALQGTVIERPTTEPDTAYVLKHWIEDQTAYFFSSRKRRKRVTERLQRLAGWIFRVGVVLAGTALVAVWLGLMPTEGSADRGAWLIAMALLPTVAGLIAGYLQSAAYQEDVREHDRLHGLFVAASKSFVDLPGSRLALIEDLGREALDESANWAHLHKSHEPEIPAG